MNEYKIIAPEFKIEIDGEQLNPELRSLVVLAEVIEEVNVASMFRITFQLGDLQEMSGVLMQLEHFQIGSEVKVYLGAQMPALLTTGEITSIEPSLHREGSQIEIRGYDRLHKLKLGKRTKTYTKIKDSDLASELASNWDLQSEVDDTSTEIAHLFQNNRSDYDLLKERAQRLRYEVMVDDKTLFFKKPGESLSPEITLEHGADFTSFQAYYRAVYKGEQIDTRDWDYKKKEVIEASAGPGDEVSTMEAEETGVDTTQKAFGSAASSLLKTLAADQDEAQATALAEFNRNLLNSVNAVVSLEGTPEIRRAKTVRLTKLGRFSGVYYIYKTSHTLNQQGYFTRFHGRRTGL